SVYDIFARDYSLNMSKTRGRELYIKTFDEGILISSGEAGANQLWNNLYFYNSTGGFLNIPALFTTNSTIVESGPVRVLINYWNYSSVYENFSNCGANICLGWEEFSAFYPDRYFIYLSMRGNYTGFRFGGGGTYFTNFYYPDNILWGAGVFKEDNTLYNTFDFGIIARSTALVPSIAAKYYMILYDNDTTNRTASWIILNYTGWSSDQILYDNIGGDRTCAKIQSGNSQGNPGNCPNVSIAWMWMFGRNGNIAISNESSNLIHDSVYKMRIQDIQNPASIEIITGNFVGFERFFGTYNLTASSNKVHFNFTLGNYNRSYPIFHIKELSNVSAIKDHVWWKNYTASSSWQKLENFTDFVIQEGNSSYFGYDYVLLMLNYTLINTSQTYEIWISNETDPEIFVEQPQNYTLSISLNTTKVWWNDGIKASGVAKYDDGIGITGTVEITIDGSNFDCPDTNDGNWSCEFNAPNKIGSYIVTVTITNATGHKFQNSTWLKVSPNYGKTSIGSITRVVYELPLLIQDLNGEIKTVLARIIVWKG
ncbi:MAG: hypothetical protein QXL86_02325, partial [Candidatus Aenigmatarchaeota archaeon]